MSEESHPVHSTGNPNESASVEDDLKGNVEVKGESTVESDKKSGPNETLENIFASTCAEAATGQCDLLDSAERDGDKSTLSEDEAAVNGTAESSIEETLQPTTAISPPRKNYTLLKTLAQGNEGLCTVHRSQKTGKLIVLKTVRPPLPDPSDWHPRNKPSPLPTEVCILRRLQAERFRPHRNIVHLLAPSPSPFPHTIHLEFCSGGDLGDQRYHFHLQGIPFTPPIFTLHVLISLAKALAYFHHGTDYGSGFTPNEWQPIIHGDIKPDNIFLRWPSRGKYGMPDVVLGDFGGARLATESRGIVGTPRWDSPEVHEITELRKTDSAAYEQRKADKIMTTKSDIYQLGLVIHLLATGRYFETGDDPSTIDFPPEHKNIAGVLAFIVWCLQPEPAERPECTTGSENGLLFAVGMFELKRKFRVKQDGKLDKGIWNISELRDESLIQRVCGLWKRKLRK